mmetsp:Transcript_133032/g.332005  ORF Transcript_133032/g.332005 Transcript_133032/m.332005 type:complete len:447 (-) Transcript_133032:229-1569(-)
MAAEESARGVSCGGEDTSALLAEMGGEEPEAPELVGYSHRRRLAFLAAATLLFASAIVAVVVLGVRRAALTTSSPGSLDDFAQLSDVEDDGVLLKDGVLSTCQGCQQRHSSPARKPANSSHFLQSSKPGELDIQWFGETKTKYFEGATTVQNNTGMILHEQPFEKFYLMNSPRHTSTKRHDYAYLKLVGNSFRVNVDMGHHAASCGCNVAFFLVSMPGTGGGDGHDHYCDANCVGGICCAEFDLMEMNKHTLQVTSHACSDYKKPPARSSSEACDHGGSPTIKFGNGGQDFGPGSQYTIDSKKRFEFRMDFPIENGNLVGHVKLSQEGRTVSKSMYNLNTIWGALADGMALVLDAWHSEDLTWLDGGVCHTPERCNMASTAFDSFVIQKLTGSRRRRRRRSGNRCPGQNGFDCGWADQWGCNNDDGSEGFCRCCCERMSQSCRWSR